MLQTFLYPILGRVTADLHPSTAETRPFCGAAPPAFPPLPARPRAHSCILFYMLIWRQKKHKQKNSCCNKLPDLSFSVWLGGRPSSPERCSAVPKPPKLRHLVGFQLEQKPGIYSKERGAGACGRRLPVVTCSMALSLNIERCKTPWKNCQPLVFNSLVIILQAANNCNNLGLFKSTFVSSFTA